jgi:hypothetical protein
MELTGEELTLILHARGNRHDSAQCRWCREVAYFAQKLVTSERTLNSIIAG